MSAIVGAMLGNSWTSIIGAVLGIVYYLQSSGTKMPETKAEWWALVVGMLLAAFGVVAKDATTGSKPGKK